MAGITKKFFALILTSIVLFTGRTSYCEDKLNIAVCHPWLVLLASFIGGPEVSVIPLRTWNANGDLIIAERGRTLRELESNAKIIALDINDAVAAGINDKNMNNFTVMYLYSPFPVSMNTLYDPSVIPFVAQRILTALSEWDPQNYPYYQRRLAEFQVRLSSSILVGSVLKDITICDLSGSCGVLLQAAGCKVIRPEEFEKWQKGNFSGLREYLESQRAQDIMIVYDDDTSPVLKRYLSGRADAFRWLRPSLEKDYPTFLHEQYISLWQKIISKPLPSRKGKR